MISIFKTNIASNHDLNKIRPYFNVILADFKWTVDLLDCDKILRVDSKVNKNDEIISVARSHGFLCENLDTFHTEPSF
jgi:hypothetical protein